MNTMRKLFVSLFVMVAIFAATVPSVFATDHVSIVEFKNLTGIEIRPCNGDHWNGSCLTAQNTNDSDVVIEVHIDDWRDSNDGWQSYHLNSGESRNFKGTCGQIDFRFGGYQTGAYTDQSNCNEETPEPGDTPTPIETPIAKVTPEPSPWTTGGFLCAVYTDFELKPMVYAQIWNGSGWDSWDGYVLVNYKTEMGLWEIGIYSNLGAASSGRFLISYESGLHTIEVELPSGNSCWINDEHGLEVEPTIVIGSIADFMLKYGAFEGLTPGAICDVHSGDFYVGQFEVRQDGHLDVYSDHAAKATDWRVENCEVEAVQVGFETNWNLGIYSGADPGIEFDLAGRGMPNSVDILVDGIVVTHPVESREQAGSYVGRWEYSGIPENAKIEVCAYWETVFSCHDVTNAGSDLAIGNDGGMWQFDGNGNIRLYPGDTWNSIRNQVDPGMSHEDFRAKWLETFGSFQEGLVYDMSLWS